jgi:hypothetical protein
MMARVSRSRIASFSGSGIAPALRGGAMSITCALAALLSIAGAARAFESLVARLPHERRSELFARRSASALVKDGYLIGRGQERSDVLPNGRLFVDRTRTYTRVKHPETGKVFALAEPWQVHSTLELSPSLRLIETTTDVRFHRSVDRAMGYAFSEKFESLFKWDRAHTVANARGDTLTRTLTRAGKVVERDTYRYPNDAIPLEIVGLVLAHAVKNRVATFDYELLLPGGDRHGIASRVHRTRDLKRFAKGYPVPSSRMQASGEVAIVDMWLASPIKRVFFPHHFYLVYSSENPADLLGLWGGDPDEHLQAFKE